MDYPCQSTDTPEGTTEHKATHTSTEEPKKARNCRNVLVLSGKDLVVRGDHRSGFCERLQEAPSMSSRPNGSQLQGVPPLGKVEPIGDSSCTSGIMYLRWGGKALWHKQQQWERGEQICEIKGSADTKASKEEGVICAPECGAEITWQPVVMQIAPVQLQWRRDPPTDHWRLQTKAWRVWMWGTSDTTCMWWTDHNLHPAALL